METIRVRAIKPGYYNEQQRNVGDVFLLSPIVRKSKFKNKTFKKSDEIDANEAADLSEKYENGVIPAEDQFSDLWMEKVDDDVDLTEPKRNSDVDPRFTKNDDVPEIKEYHEKKEQEKAEEVKRKKQEDQKAGKKVSRAGSDSNKYGTDVINAAEAKDESSESDDDNLEEEPVSDPELDPKNEDVNH